MFKKIISLMLVALLIQTTSFVLPGTAFGRENNSSLGAEIKDRVMSYGTGTNVKVKLISEKKLSGVIKEIKSEYFILDDAKLHRSSEIYYSEVKKVKQNHLSTGAKIGIGLGVAALAGIIIAIVSRGKKKEPDCIQTTQAGVPCPPGCVCIQ